MRTAIAFTLLSVIASAVSASEAPAVSKAPKQNAAACKKNELGGVVASNVKAKNGDYVTRYNGDKTPFKTPANAGELYVKVSKLKAGDVNCFLDDGS